ncbi:MAG: CCA tRNA nucleotidyltransferase [Candidatus Woesearchaeota archaeon]|nr:CCA tRNA nucleotidyltransferase [Candidatus Woesearchaeota archaeon]
MDFKKVLATCKPSPEEELHLQKLVKEILSKIKIPGAKPILGGSGAKNTWLKGTHDIDIYVKFNVKQYSHKTDQLADILEKALKKQFKLDRLHGSRDYYQVYKAPYTVEIVPILDIKKASEAKNITDFSHLHVAYVQKYKKVADEIRLAKLFAKAQGIYGAESYMQGFSGYVMELLVIHYGSFMKMMRTVAKWKETTIIGDKKEALSLNPAKKVSPLILVDPVQPERNAAAALSEEKYQQCIKACQKFLKHPSENLFEEEEINWEKIKKKGTVWYCAVTPLPEKKDVAGAKMLKAFDFTKQTLERAEFKLYKSGWQYAAPSFFYFVVDKKPLSPTLLRQGPPLTHPEGVLHFKKQHKKILTKKGRLYAEVPREFTHVQDCLKSVLASENVVNRVKNVSVSIL